MTETVNVNLQYMALFAACFVSKMEDKAVSVYHDDRKILDDTKIIKMVITKLLSICLTTEICDNRDC